MRKKTQDKILTIISIATIVFLVFSASFFIVLFNKSFYDQSLSKYGAYTKIGVEGVRSTVDNLINYLISENSDISQVSALSIFTEKEKSHLKDVHSLISFLKYATIICALLLAASLYLMHQRKILKKSIKKILKISAISNVIALAALLLLTINFEWSFIAFHKMFFSQGNYLFAPDSLIKILFPDEFFRDFFAKVLFNVFIFTMLLFTVGGTNLFIESEN